MINKVLAAILDSMMISVIELWILALSKNLSGREFIFSKIELVFTEHISAEVFRQLSRLFNLNYKVYSLSNEFLWFFWNKFFRNF
jgi:hypothetical protein